MWYLMDEVANATINNKNFNPDEWCIDDAEIFEKAALMIRREVGKRERKKRQLECEDK